MPMSDVLGLVLGGGRGERLWPLTRERAKPAVPIGGKYRLIDIPLSNCLNSGVHRVAILTQFNSVSLHRHISQTYNFDFFRPGWVQVWAAEQSLTSEDGWYQGTADAVRKQLFEIRATGASHVLVLAGDHLYRMDYAEMVTQHRSTDADITVAAKPVSREEAGRFGILKHGRDNRITAFCEKPKTEVQLAEFASRNDPAAPYLGSMGIYVFKIDALMALLDSKYDDFGSDIIPNALGTHHVFAYPFHGYWEDIGTIRSFFDANLALARSDSPFRFHDPVRPIFTHPRFLPGSRIYDVRLDHVLMCDGCLIEGAEIHDSLVGIRSVIDEDVLIRDSILMGADHYDPTDFQATAELPAIGVGRASHVRGAIIDKNARIGANVRIEPFPVGTEIRERDWTVRDGIVIIPKNAVIRAGTVIAPDA